MIYFYLINANAYLEFYFLPNTSALGKFQNSPHANTYYVRN